jgi:hypothetical protein
MAGDPFSIASGAAGVVSLGLSVCQGLLAYYDPYKAYNEEIKNLTIRTEGLKSVLQGLQQLLTTHEALDVSQTMNLMPIVVTTFLNCHEGLQSLQDRLDKYPRKRSTKISKIEALFDTKRLQYPFQRGTIMALADSVKSLQDNLAIAMALLHL